MKSELVAAAHAAKDHDMMPEYLWPDLDMDAWFHRKVPTAPDRRRQFRVIDGGRK